MNTLVIHPKDRSTEFLTRVYENIDATVVTGGMTKETLRRLVEDHDRVIMLGHGSPWGLMAVGQFEGADCEIVDDSFNEALAKKDNSIFVWCNADCYVRKHKLRGFHTGMFISEPWEAYTHRVDATRDQVEESNQRFSETLRRNLWRNSMNGMHQVVRKHYGDLALHNPVAKYNHDRLYVS